MSTNFPSGLMSSGSPVRTTGGGGAMESVPHIGKTWWVDGTNGLDSNDGLSWNNAKATIQAALTAQIAGTTSLGDIIYVLPGYYAETIVGNLTNCKLIGQNPFTVRIQPTDGHAYSGNLHDAVVSGICFDSPSTSNTTYAAFRSTTIQDSVIENCEFCCKVNVQYSVGFMVGVHATATTSTYFHRSSFRNNKIMSNGGSQVFDYGFCLGSGSGDATNSNARTMWNSDVTNNIICSKQNGIRIIGNYAGSYGSVLRGNVIMGDANNHNETYGSGIYSLDDTNATKLSRIWVIDNRISSDTDCIENFTVQLTQGNIVGQGGVGTTTPVDETIAN